MNNEQFLQKLETLADIFTFKKKKLVFSPYKGVKSFYSLVFEIFAIIGFVQYDWNVHINETFIATHRQDITMLAIFFTAFGLMIFFLLKIMSSHSINKIGRAHV